MVQGSLGQPKSARGPHFWKIAILRAKIWTFSEILVDFAPKQCFTESVEGPHWWASRAAGWPQLSVGSTTYIYQKNGLNFTFSSHSVGDGMESAQKCLLAYFLSLWFKTWYNTLVKKFLKSINLRLKIIKNQHYGRFLKKRLYRISNMSSQNIYIPVERSIIGLFRTGYIKFSKESGFRDISIERGSSQSQ